MFRSLNERAGVIYSIDPSFLERVQKNFLNESQISGSGIKSLVILFSVPAFCVLAWLADLSIALPQVFSFCRQTAARLSLVSYLFNPDDCVSHVTAHAGQQKNKKDALPVQLSLSLLRDGTQIRFSVPLFYYIFYYSCSLPPFAF